MGEMLPQVEVIPGRGRGRQITDTILQWALLITGGQEIVRAIRRNGRLCCRSARPSGSMKHQGGEPDDRKK